MQALEPVNILISRSRHVSHAQPLLPDRMFGIISQKGENIFSQANQSLELVKKWLISLLMLQRLRMSPFSRRRNRSEGIPADRLIFQCNTLSKFTTAINFLFLR
jgi:hypothetical protein